MDNLTEQEKQAIWQEFEDSLHTNKCSYCGKSPANITTQSIGDHYQFCSFSCVQYWASGEAFMSGQKSKFEDELIKESLVQIGECKRCNHQVELVYRHKSDKEQQCTDVEGKFRCECNQAEPKAKEEER